MTLNQDLNTLIDKCKTKRIVKVQELQNILQDVQFDPRLIEDNIDDINTDVRRFISDLNAGRKVLSHYMGSTYNSWERGSSLIFWRWNHKTLARDGFFPYISHSLPSNMKKTKDCYIRS